MEIPEPNGPPYLNPERGDPERPVCGICPATRYPRDQFVIYNRPSWECPFNPANGNRYTHDGVPACVHPDKIGLGPDRIADRPASEGAAGRSGGAGPPPEFAGFLGCSPRTVATPVMMRRPT